MYLHLINIKEKQTVFTWYSKLTYLRISGLKKVFHFSFRRS